VLGFVGKAAADHEGTKKALICCSRSAVPRAKRWPEMLLLLVGPGWQTLRARLESRGVRTEWRSYDRTEGTVSGPTGPWTLSW